MEEYFYLNNTYDPNYCELQRNEDPMLNVTDIDQTIQCPPVPQLQPPIQNSEEQSHSSDQITVKPRQKRKYTRATDERRNTPQYKARLEKNRIAVQNYRNKKLKIEKEKVIRYNYNNIKLVIYITGRK